MKYTALVEALINKFKPSKGKTVAIYPGGFKPPHKGHFNALNYLLDEADSGIVFIGKGVRNGITAKQSKQIWNIYKKYLRKPVEVIISERTPVVSTYEYADSNPEKNIIVGAGPGDEKRFDYFQKNIDTYPLVKVINIPAMNNRFSGTQTRQMIATKQQNIIDQFIPTTEKGEKDIPLITPQDKQTISNILKI